MTLPATAAELGYAVSFLSRLGAPLSRPLQVAVTAWERGESGGLSRVIGNNPFNLRPGADDADLRSGIRTSTSGNGQFSVYPNLSAGYRAAAQRLLGAGSDWRHYDAVVTAARAGDPTGFLNALAASAWDAGRYGTRNGGPNMLLPIYRALGGAFAAPHRSAIVTVPTALWNDGTRRWVYNGPNAIKPGTRLRVRSAGYLKGGRRTYPIIPGTTYGGYFVPIAHVRLV